jgi:rRNA-processing protein FCF1
MPKVVLDTNALLLPFERSINIDAQLRSLLGECQIFVPGPIVGELKRSPSKNAPAALRLLSRYTIEDTMTSGDAAVIELAEKLNAYVVTNDRLLISKLRKKRIKVVLLRGGNHLDLDDGV